MSKMDIKKELIRNLENELTGGDSNMKYFDCTTVEAEGILKRLKSGSYDKLIEVLTTKVDLHKFLKYDFERQKSTTPSEPSLKEYKIHCLKYDLDKALHFLSLDNPEEKEEIYQEKIERLLTNLTSGVYDELLLEKDFFFVVPIKAEPLLEWNEARENNCQKSKATLSNYLVFNFYYSLMDHVRRVNTWKDTFGSDYTSHTTGHKQTPTTAEEFKRYKDLANELVTQDYDWREARNVIREFNKLDIFNNYKFPHNPEEIIKCFAHNKNIVFPEYAEKGKCSHDLEAISERARDLLAVLDSSNLTNIYLNKDEDKVDEYLRKMITSQFDIESVYKECYSDISKKEIKNILENPSLYSDYEIKNVFASFPNKMKQNLCNLAKGILYSLSTYQEESYINIFDDAINLQKVQNCWHGTIYYNNYNSVRLPNGDIIYSIPYEDIESTYYSYQQEYEYYRRNSTSDLEYIEGCAEIAGNVIMSQIFIDGNKRTTKCLFNAMLAVKGIVPPILNFCNSESDLFEQFAYNRGNRFRPAKKTILEETLKIAKYFNNDSKENAANKEYVKK